MNKSLTASLALLVLNTVLSAPVLAARVPDCGKNGPSKTKPSPRDSEYDHYRTAKVMATAGPNGNTTFQNKERRLPPVARNEVYYEYDLGQDGFGGRGADRAVLLVVTGKDKRQVKASYYTRDHYGKFCSIAS